MSSFTSLSGSSVTLDKGELNGFRSSLSCETIAPGDASYDEARAVWNAMIDKRPALIVRCADTEDIIKCVNFVAKHSILSSVRGAGHNVAGSAVVDGGLVIDLSGMTDVKVDAANRTAQIQPGATLGHVDKATQEHGLIAPTGINSTTGIAGLVLGGGIGWNSRKYGLTSDALKSADIVTADGKTIHADASENSDLYWALRGGGGNFGVVTNFEFNLYPVGPEVYAGMVVFPHAEGKSVLEKYRELAISVSRETTIWVVLRKAPPLPFVSEEYHGQEVVVVPFCSSADPERAKTEMEPLKSFGTVVGEHTGTMPFVDWQQAFDPLLAPGERNYWKTQNFTAMSDGMIGTALKYAGAFPSDDCEVFIGRLGEAACEPAPEATAWPHRDVEFIMNVHGRWSDAADDEKCIDWSRKLHKDMGAFATGGEYLNFMTADEYDKVAAAFGSNFERLQEIKKKYDPNNLFRSNLNIKPM